jgi:hypothetical protein
MACHWCMIINSRQYYAKIGWYYFNVTQKLVQVWLKSTSEEVKLPIEKAKVFKAIVLNNKF